MNPDFLCRNILWFLEKASLQKTAQPCHCTWLAVLQLSFYYFLQDVLWNMERIVLPYLADKQKYII